MTKSPDRLRIAFDLDGVLADLGTVLRREADRLLAERSAAVQTTSEGKGGGTAEGVRVNAATLFRTADDAAGGAATGLDAASRALQHATHGISLSGALEQQVWTTVLKVENFWETLPEKEPGAIARLATLADQHRWEVLFITSRPESAGDTIQRQTQRWLERHGFPLPSVFVVQGSRGRIAAALDLEVVVDDRPDNCVDVMAESTARAILVWPGTDHVPARARELGIGHVPGVIACLDLLARTTEPQPGPARLANRLRSLLGLTTS